MRINAPQEPFELTLASPRGSYLLRYRPVDEWDGRIEMMIDGVEVGGAVLLAELRADGGRALCGMTFGFFDLYRDEFWFELRPDHRPAYIEYWGNRVLWRRDAALDEG